MMAAAASGPGDIGAGLRDLFAFASGLLGDVTCGGPFERAGPARHGARARTGGPWGGWWPGPPGPPGPPRGTKASRGDVRAAILALLREGPRNGYQIMSDIEERSGGAWRRDRADCARGHA